MESGKHVMFGVPKTKSFDVFSEMPRHFAKPERSLWADINLAGSEVGCFLEGPTFDLYGNLFITDIPFGRIFRIDTDGRWSIVTAYEGWPNGMKTDAQGDLLIADHKLGLLHVSASTGNCDVLLNEIDGEPLLGLNDLTISADGSIYATDQGQTGLHDPRGRVLRVQADGHAQILIDNGPSPNGLVFDRHKPWLYVAMTRGNAIWRIPLLNSAATKVGIAVQLSGGVGPDGLAVDRRGQLLVVQAPIWVWRFDRFGRPIDLWQADEDSYVTNLVIREKSGNETMYVTDSIAGRILYASIGG
jgi:gluconolactonase